jgi:tetratricopeptide (TPR) repeat protein
MPTQKKSLTWLWITLGAVGAAAVIGIAAFLLLGKDDVPGTGPTTDPVAAATADAAMKTYLDARKSGDFAAAYKLLSAKAREAYTQAEYTAYYKEHALDSFGDITVGQAQDPWAEVIVHDFNAGGSPLPEAPFTLVKESGGYRVALEVPLLDRMDKAFEGKQYAEVEKLAALMEAINPKSYYAQYNRGWGQMEQDQYDKALPAFTAAVEYAIAEDKAEAVRSLGLAHANLGQWDKAAIQLEEAVGLAEPYETAYDVNWKQNLFGDLALVYEKAGMIEQAIDLLEVLYKANPASTVGLGQAGRLERVPYKVEDGWATYKLIRHGVSFALPEGWVISNETTGGDFWFARHPGSPANRIDLAVYNWSESSVGKTLEEAIPWFLKHYQEPIGSPRRDISIVDQDTWDVGGHEATGLLFSDKTISVLMKVGGNWIDFHWSNNPTAQQDADDWSETIEVTW